MENASPGDATPEAGRGVAAPDAVRARRERMRAAARAQRSRATRFETPEWLDRSFVLPLTEPEVTAVPSQPTPDHDEFAAGVPDGTERTDPTFVRPPSKEVDFARIIKRAEATRLATRTASVSAGLTGLTLIGHLLSPSSVTLALLVVAALVAVVALATRLRLSAASIPHLER